MCVELSAKLSACTKLIGNVRFGNRRKRLSLARCLKALTQRKRGQAGAAVLKPGANRIRIKRYQAQARVRRRKLCRRVSIRVAAKT
jgi:prolyl-tRNA editing enzyme YbaK/EbsC (Cys-tRNA(Pro) deacylase)